MFFGRVNIKEELFKQRDNHPNVLLKEVKNLLSATVSRDEEIMNRLQHKNPHNGVAWSLDETDRKNVFTLNEIKKICSTHRLRFLDSSLFRSEIPYEIIASISALEKKYHQKVERFTIIAPDDVFKLEDINKDPLLFAQLSDNEYYLVHKWGNDLNRFRSIVHFPLRNIASYFFSVFCVAALIAFLIPSEWMGFLNAESIIYLRLWLTFHSLIGLFGFFIFIGATFNISFSESNWNSNYFNS